MVEICRWPKASLSVSVTLCMETPSRPASPRSTSTMDARAALLRLGGDLAQRAGCCAGLCTSLAAHSTTSAASVLDQRVLILRAADAGGNLDVLRRLEIDRHAGNGGDRVFKPGNDVVDACAAVVARLQRDGEVAGIRRRVDRADADHRHHAGDVRIGADRGLRPGPAGAALRRRRHRCRPRSPR